MIAELLRRIFAAPELPTTHTAPPPPGATVTFDIAFEHLIDHEGGYINHPGNPPKDPSGETHWGITLRTARKAGYAGSMRELTRDQAQEIYRSAYWSRARCDKFDGAIAFQMFDAAVNHGIGNAIRFLQRAQGHVRYRRPGQIQCCSATFLYQPFELANLW